MFLRLLRPEHGQRRIADAVDRGERLLGYAITFVLDQQQRPKWERDVWSKVLVCGGAGKVAKPVWSGLPEDVSFILADTLAGGATECLLSSWSEPFMSRRWARTHALRCVAS